MDEKMDNIMDIAIACIVSAGGVGTVIIATVKFSVSIIVKRIERKYEEKFAVFQSGIDRKNYISQVRFDAEFDIYKHLSQKYGELVLKILVLFPNNQINDYVEKKGNVNELAYAAVSQLYSSAPFIPEDIYNDFMNIYEMSRELLVKVEMNRCENAMSVANGIYEKYNITIAKVREYTSKLEAI